MIDWSILIAIVSMVISGMLGLYVARTQAKKNKADDKRERDKTKVDSRSAQLQASDEIMDAAKGIVSITRQEWRDEREKRISLEGKVQDLEIELETYKGIKSRVAELEDKLAKSVEAGIVLYNQLVAAEISPLVIPCGVEVDNGSTLIKSRERRKDRGKRKGN